MDLVRQRLYVHESESLPPINPPPSSSLFVHHSSHTSFPIIAVAIIGILATAFLLVGYYVFVIKCCLNWHRIDLLRRFSFSRRRRVDEPLVVHHSPAMAVESRGLDEAAIRSIPIFKFTTRISDGEDRVAKSSIECAVCLNEFMQEEKLRIIPNCCHVFHIDCIDVWLQNNANCPLCRTSISAQRPDVIGLSLGRVLVPIPDSHSRYPNPPPDSFSGSDEDYVVIEIGPRVGPTRDIRSLSRIPESYSSSDESLTICISPSPGKISTKRITEDYYSSPNEHLMISISPSPRKISRKKGKKLSHVSSMGDECIDINRKKDDQFVVQPIRRSFSMDSAADSQLYLAVQEIIQREKPVITSEGYHPNEGCSSRGKRSFFSFGQGKGSRSAVQPLALEP